MKQTEHSPLETVYLDVRNFPSIQKGNAITRLQRLGFMRNVRFSCVLDHEHEETMAHRKVWDYRPIDKETFPSSSVQCVYHTSMLHIQSSRDTNITIVIGGHILTQGFKFEHYLRDIYKWYRQLPAPSKLIFVTKHVKTFCAFFINLTCKTH